MSHPINLSAPEAAAQIVALINASPRSPRQDEIEAIIVRIGTGAAKETPISDLRIRLRMAMAKSDAALQVLSRLLPGTECDLAEAERAQWLDEFAAMEKEIPNPPLCFEDLVARAVIGATASTRCRQVSFRTKADPPVGSHGAKCQNRNSPTGSLSVPIVRLAYPEALSRRVLRGVRMQAATGSTASPVLLRLSRSSSP